MIVRLLLSTPDILIPLQVELELISRLSLQAIISVKQFLTQSLIHKKDQQQRGSKQRNLYLNREPSGIHKVILALYRLVNIKDTGHIYRNAPETLS